MTEVAHLTTIPAAATDALKAVKDMVFAVEAADPVAQSAYLHLAKYGLQDALRTIERDIASAERRVAEKSPRTVIKAYAADDETAPPALADAAE